MKVKEEKIYVVEFMQYTNCMKDTVSKNDGSLNYIDVKEPVLVRESEIDKLKEYGKGFRYVEYVGMLREFMEETKVDIR